MVVKTYTKDSLRRIWNFIKSLFGVDSDTLDEAILRSNDLFEAINEGKLKHKAPTEFFGEAYRPIEGMTHTTSAKIINNLHSNFFRHLFKSNESIESLLSGDN